MKKDTFQEHLNLFEEIINGYPPVEAIETKLKSLKESALAKSDDSPNKDRKMTFSQSSAIAGRVDSYIKGEYGEQVKRVDSRSAFQKGLL